MNMEAVSSIIGQVSNFVWGPVMLGLLVGTGVVMTIRLRFRPWTHLFQAITYIFRRDKSATGDVRPFEALSIALASTVGAGNIAGVATAMTLGGPGALFWMWVAALFGLSTQYSECVLAVKYRVTNARGEKSGGPMYALHHGFPNKKIGRVLAILFALFTVLASFGIGNMVQANTIADSLNSSFGLSKWVCGILICSYCLLVVLGGVKSIARNAVILVPAMLAFYFVASLVIIALNLDKVPEGIMAIVVGAFNPEGVAGGVTGTFVATAMRYGVARGVFSNEAGLGSSPIVAAAAQTDHPARQGYVSMTGTFFDTFIICTLTGLVIACSGVLEAGMGAKGAALTISAFAKTLGAWGGYVVTIAIVCFVLTTITGWAYYGEKATEYLFGTQKAVLPYRVLICFLPFVGCVAQLSVIWDLSDIFNALMAFPNLIAVLALGGVVVAETKDFHNRHLPALKSKGE